MGSASATRDLSPSSILQAGVNSLFHKRTVRISTLFTRSREPQAQLVRCLMFQPRRFCIDPLGIYWSRGCVRFYKRGQQALHARGSEDPDRCPGRRLSVLHHRLGEAKVDQCDQRGRQRRPWTPSNFRRVLSSSCSAPGQGTPCFGRIGANSVRAESSADGGRASCCTCASTRDEKETYGHSCAAACCRSDWGRRQGAATGAPPALPPGSEPGARGPPES